jgi:nitrate/nitrite transporter NarK
VVLVAVVKLGIGLSIFPPRIPATMALPVHLGKVARVVMGSPTPSFGRILVVLVAVVGPVPWVVMAHIVVIPL